MKLTATEQEKQNLSTLLHEIQDRSLQQILRCILFRGEDIEETIARQRPETQLEKS